MSDHVPQPTESELRAMMVTALDEVQAARRRMISETQAPVDHTEESMRPAETMIVRPLGPLGQIKELQKKFPDAYRAILRAAVRVIEQNHKTRRRLYVLLNCAPKERE
jgi:hypothetical protein